MLIHGQTASNILTPLLVDATGRPLVVLDGVTGSVVTVQASGGDKIFSYESAVGQETSNLALAAGTNSINGAAVPAGKVWVLTNFAIRYSGTVAGVALYAALVLAGSARTLFNQLTVTSGLYYDRQGQWVLAAGGNALLTVSGATLNDDAYRSEERRVGK